MERRSLLKLAALSLPALGGGYRVAGSLTARAAVSAARTTEPGAWSRLVQLKDASGRPAYAVHAVLLPTGHVVMAGGSFRRRRIEFMFDPTVIAPTITVHPMSMPTDREADYLLCAGNAQLPDGRVLFSGGSRPGDVGLGYSMLFDAEARRWTRIPDDMAGGRRWYPTNTRLPDGRMLVTGGFFDFGETPNRSIEIFDPSAYDAGSNPWTELISHADNRWIIEPVGEDYTHVFLLPRPVVVRGHARQLVMFGKTGVIHFVNYTDPFEDPNARFAVRRHSRRPGPGDALLAAAATSVLLPDGRIMVIGGSTDRTLQQRADIYDPVADEWESIDTGVGRLYPTAILLPDGTVLVVNGEGPRNARAPQIIHPQSGRVLTGPAWPDDSVRGYHNVALLLPDGRILTAGGSGRREFSPEGERTDLRYYSPGYLARPELRPEVSRAGSVMRYNAPYAIRYENGPVHRVTMIALGAVTHAFDENQRFIELFSGTSTGGRLIVRGPATAAVAPPGDYMLFLLRRVTARGEAVEIPSPAHMVRVLPIRT